MASYTASVGGTTVFSEVVDTPSAPRDQLGRIVTRVETNGGAAVTDQYSYDLRGRLTDVFRGGALYEHYGYDDNGNRTLLQTPTESIVGVYDAQDRLLSYGTETFTYTANGELATKTDTATGETTAYQYDVRGNLVRVDLPNGDVIEYLIDGQDRRVGKKKNGVLEKQWLYRNGLDIVAELDGSGNLVSRFVYSGRNNALELMFRGGVKYRILSDHLGSPRAILDSATGAFVWRAEINPWGVRTVTLGADDFLPVGFAHGSFDVDTGFVRFGARDYDPRLGRWVSKDPTRFLGGLNAYVYAANDPVNRLDRNGRDWEAFECIGGLIACLADCYFEQTGGNCPITCGNALASCGSLFENQEPDEKLPPTDFVEQCKQGVRSECTGYDAGIIPGCSDVEAYAESKCNFDEMQCK